MMDGNLGDAPEAIGFDIGGTNLRAAVIGASGTVRNLLSERVVLDRQGFVSRIDRIVRDLDPGGQMPIGIGLPGRVDTAANLPVTAGYLDISGLSLPELIDGGLRRVYLDNDAAMALRAEMVMGVARGLGNVVILTIGTGIGGAVALDHHMIRGRAFAGQFGHLSVDASTGLRCKCGRSGCLETAASGSALGRLVKSEGCPKGIRGIDLIVQAKAADGAARRIIERWASALRSGTDALIAAFDPDMVVIGGGLASEALAALEFAPVLSTWFMRPVKAAQLGDHAGIIGAGLYALSGGCGIIGAERLS